MSNDIKIGLFGYGCVGQGLHDVLNNSKGFRSNIDTIVVKDKNKERRLPQSAFSYSKEDILNKEDIDLVVELIDNSEQALEITKSALEKGKNVVSANKKMIAENFKELVDLQKKHNAGLLYEASACASIPIIRTLEEYYDNELLESVSGIFNGSSNYILSKVINEGLDYPSALAKAQALGFAESDPTLDVGGYDAKYKLVILSGHAYGVFINPEKIFNLGIDNLNQSIIDYARNNGLKIKLIAQVVRLDDKNITAYVLPKLVNSDHPLYNVENENNGVIVRAAFSDEQIFIGKGAGGHPTGSAVLSDISANSYDYKYEYKKLSQSNKFLFTNNVTLDIVATGFNDDLQKIPFVSITQQEDGLIEGKIKLETLIASQDEIRNSGIFVASKGEPEVLHTTFKTKRELVEA